MMIRKNLIILGVLVGSLFLTNMSLGKKNTPRILSHLEAKAKLDSVEFSNYEQSANLVLQKYETRITGEMLAKSWRKTKLETNIEVPVHLALSQAFLESSFGESKLSKSKNNPYSIRSGNGYYKKFGTLQEGIDSYYSLISRKYLSCKPLEKLLVNFTNCSGYRYAGDSLYETRLKKTIRKFQMVGNI